MTEVRDNPAPLRLLALAPNWLGDVVMFTPLLSLLDDARREISETTGRPLHLVLGVRRAWADLFRDDPRVDELFILERSGRSGGIKGIWKLASRLKAGHFDAVLLGPPSLRVGLAARLAGIGSRVGYRTDGRSLLLTTPLPHVPRGQLHFSREMIGLGEAWLASLGCSVSSSGLGLPETSLPACSATAPADVGSGRPVWALAPGTTYGEAKTWPLVRVQEFVTLATRDGGPRIVLLGDSSAREFVARLQAGFAGSWSRDLTASSDVVDLTGRTDLPAAVGVLKAARVFIGNDSGLMHLAAALGLPTIGIFGSSNPQWTSPVGPRTTAVVPEGFSCRPCYRKTCNQAEFCLETVEAETVLDAVRKFSQSTGAVGGDR